MPTSRSILHLDMDAFFAAVEQRDYPELRGKPLLIGHDGPRGVVATASYEARPFGCRSAQPMAVAKRLCPHAIIVPVRFERYREVSRQMFEILEAFTPIIEPLSIDEAFLDLTGTERAQGPAEHVARKLKQRIQSDLRLTASVGVAPNKFLAKLASDLRKPDALVVIAPEDISHLLPPLPVTKLWGIGKATETRLASFGIKTIADLLQKSPDWMAQHFGSEATRYFNLARGIDDRPVTTDREAKSIGHERTFETDVEDPDAIRSVLLDQVEQVAQRLRRHGFHASGISLKIRFGKFETINRSMTLSAPTTSTNVLWHAARELFDRWTFQPVRLIGITAERLSDGKQQLELFADPKKEKQTKLDGMADRINEKFGKRAIRRGGSG
jgi:DNA polymerase IV